LALKRMKGKLEEKTEAILDLRTEIQHMKNDIEKLEKDSDQKDELLEAAMRDVEQYRSWWLNEIQFMKLLLNKIPQPNRDIDLVRASQAHYLGHY
jgi:predicted  nucleic acid-binding Zn-ribbon protein